MYEAARIAVPLEPAGAPPARPAEAVAWLRPAAGGKVRVHIHDAASLPAGLEADWAGLAAEAAEANSYAEHWFIAASLEAFGDTRPLRLAEVRRGNVLIGVMPLAIERDYGRSRVRFVQNWCHHNLFLGTPLVRRGEETDFWSALLAELDRAQWARGFFHLRGVVENGPVHRGLVSAAAGLGRGCALIHGESRALLEGAFEADAYYRAAVRPKKRKELRRLESRLAELGEVRVRALGPEDALEPWCDAFLALEAKSWKGEAGTALACDPRTERFFRRALAGARAAGRLHFLRLDLDGRAVAMLINFLAPPGGYSFKTAFDPAYARFSPGVLIQLDNLRSLAAAGLDWMDSCAAEQHPMIDSLWSGRRSVVRVTVRLSGLRRTLVFAACRSLETASAAIRRLIARPA